MCACESASELTSESEEVYDEMLSYTSWGCDYYEPGGYTPGDEKFYEEFLSSLRTEAVASPEAYSDTTIFKSGATGRLQLTFANKTCELKDTKTVHEICAVEKGMRTEYHYPDQTLAYDLVDDLWYDIRVSGDTIYAKLMRGDEVRQQASRRAEHWYEYANVVKSSESYDKTTTDAQTYSFTRSGHTVYLTNESGTLEGEMNNEGNKIDIDDYGTLYLSK